MYIFNYIKDEAITNSQALFHILLKKKDVKSAYSYVFSKLFVRNVGPGLLDPLYRRFPQLAPYPREIEVEITTRCPLKCIMCEHTYWDEPKKDLSLGEYKYIIDQFQHLRWINTTGEGSSYLNKQFLDILAYTKSKGIFVKMVESFTMLTEEQIKETIKLGVERIICSMEGATKETYEKIRVGASFDKVISNLLLFDEWKRKLRSPLPELSFRYILMSTNFSEVFDFIKLINSLGVGSSIDVVGILDFDEIKSLSIKERSELIEELKRVANENNLKVPLGPTITRFPITTCTFWTQPYIMMGGYVMPCCGVMMSNRRDYLRKYALGNIFEKSFKEIWYSPTYKKLRCTVPQKEGPLHPLCVDCRSVDTIGRKGGEEFFKTEEM